MSSLSVVPKTSKRSVGRPKLLEKTEILMSANRLGLDGLTMKRLAAELNIGTATLYEYFPNRKALIEQAAVIALSDFNLPTDNGQDWEALVWDYVACLVGIFADNPSFFANYQRTEYGFAAQFKLVEPFLESMTRRGFKSKSAMNLFNGIAMAAIAGSIEKTRQRYFETKDDTMARAAYREINNSNLAEFPLMNEVLGIFTAPPDEKIQSLLVPFIKQFKSQNSQ